MSELTQEEVNKIFIIHIYTIFINYRAILIREMESFAMTMTLQLKVYATKLVFCFFG